MIDTARRWRVLTGSLIVGVACLLSLTCGTAAAEPLPLPPPVPTPAASPAAQPVAVGTPTVAAAVPQTVQPATSVTLIDFLKGKGVQLEPQNPRDFKALTIVLPMPRGWSLVPDPNVPDAYAVIADRLGGDGLYTSNAQVIVYKLVGGEFDPREAITHGFIDAQQLPAWRLNTASFTEFGGFPASRIEGTYRDNNMTLNTFRRYVLATADPDKYLVSFSVTTTADQVVPTGDATDAVINGFRIQPPGPPVPTPSPQTRPS